MLTHDVTGKMLTHVGPWSRYVRNSRLCLHT